LRSKRFYGWLAWGLLASCAALTVVALFLMYLNGPHRIVERLVYPLVFLAFAVVGALVASRRPENPIGWIFCVFAITNVLWALALEYTLYAFVVDPSPLPGREIAA
jgi:FtsH-binding integral membrane protein